VSRDRVILLARPENFIARPAGVKHQSQTSSWRTLVRALPCWWSRDKRPYSWLYSRQCELRSYGAGRLHRLFWAMSFLDVRPVFSSQLGDRSAAAMTRWWPSAGAVRAKWPKYLRHLTTSETGKQLKEVTFVVCLVNGIRKFLKPNWRRISLKCVIDTRYRLQMKFLSYCRNAACFWLQFV